jgi:nucleoside-diphosphate-sugar epimerase
MVIGCTPGIYNIGSPSVIPMSYVMDILVKLSGTAPPMKLAEGLGSKDQGAFPAISVRKIADACGWAPEIPLEETLMGLLQYWRQR